ncbi:MAG: ATP-binding cassette domain-containing protein [bacterium]|nr:ATP-binding cassette domain-containing protein [bacterium]
MSKAELDPMLVAPNDLASLAYSTLSRVASGLGIPIERATLDLPRNEKSVDKTDFIQLLINAGTQFGLVIKETELRDVNLLFDIVQDGFPVVLTGPQGEGCRVIRRPVGRQLEVNFIEEGKGVSTSKVSKRELQRTLIDLPDLHVLVGKEALECNSLSAAPFDGHGPHGHGHGHEHLSPVRRFLRLLKLDARDVWIILLFASVAGILGLATPLAIESLVNVVSWGIYLQPLLVLALMLMFCLGLSAALRILQTVVVEIIQRRQLVRIVSDLAHRFPRASQSALTGQYPRELANRIFDIMTIQKASATLLLDGVSILLTTLIGMVLLAFYHPFLLGFDIVLLICMVSITWLLGRGGIRSAIRESITKYRIAHWLQDVISYPGAFRVNGGEAMAVDRANRLAAEYVIARKAQFRVVIRQVIFAIGLQVVASTALLGLGGWLVIQGQLTLGQLVASELVVTVVVGAFSKAGKSLEKFYDLMAGVDKVGHMLDVPAEPTNEIDFRGDRPAEVQWSDMRLSSGAANLYVPGNRIESGAQVVVTGDLGQRELFVKALAGLNDPAMGSVEVAGFDAVRLSDGRRLGRAIGLATADEIFHGTIRENITLGRSQVGRARVRDVMNRLGLWEEVIRLEDGMDTAVQTGGFPLSRTQITLVLIARAIAAEPRLLIIHDLLDQLDGPSLETVWRELTQPNAPWTLVVTSNCERITRLTEDVIDLETA